MKKVKDCIFNLLLALQIPRVSRQCQHPEVIPVCHLQIPVRGAALRQVDGDDAGQGKVALMKYHPVLNVLSCSLQLKFGMFLDEFLCNMILDSFIEKQDFKSMK